MNRREFLTWVGVGSLATSLPLALAACNPSGTDSAAPETEAATDPDAIALGTVSELAAAGSLVATSPEKVIVVADPADESQLLAFTANCNHSNCTVEWNPDETLFVCPCHQSRFALDGSLQSGPATADLEPLTVTVEGDQIFVSA
ncbi:MAG: Rieske (2Fe-2S) protein [Spirulinaceae cyanobacterium SM2_1_0]|nr:Rieske (2Fe-2S) protein [Spirulinaceae cyanobacterium SM2_1_0]